MKKLSIQLPVLASLLVSVAATDASALTAKEVLASSADPVQQGLAIAQEADKRDFGFGDMESVSTMILRNAQGQESVREMRQKTFEMEDTSVGDKSITVFDKPKDVKGSAFLTHSNILTADKQWMFLPDLGRVKRISSKNKSGPFMGSEFAYEDLSSQEVGKYTYKYLRTEVCPTDAALQCLVVERYPAYKYSGYTKMVGWVDTQEFRSHRVDFYDMKDELLKTLESKGFKQYLGQYWRPDEMHMKNVQTDKETTLKFSGYKFGLGLKESAFTKSKLENVK